MGYIDDFEDFMEELSGMNLYAPTNKATRKEISINSMYVADDEKQRKKDGYGVLSVYAEADTGLSG